MRGTVFTLTLPAHAHSPPHKPYIVVTSIYAIKSGFECQRDSIDTQTELQREEKCKEKLRHNPMQLILMETLSGGTDELIPDTETAATPSEPGEQRDEEPGE